MIKTSKEKVRDQLRQEVLSMAQASLRKLEQNLDRVLDTNPRLVTMHADNELNAVAPKILLTALLLEEAHQWAPPWSTVTILAQARATNHSAHQIRTIRDLYKTI